MSLFDAFDDEFVYSSLEQTVIKETTNLFGGFLSAVINPPAQPRTSACNMLPNLELPCHWIPHNGTGDIRRYLGNGAFQFVQHGLHLQD